MTKKCFDHMSKIEEKPLDGNQIEQRNLYHQKKYLKIATTSMNIVFFLTLQTI